MTIAVCVFLCVIAAFYIYVAVARSQVEARVAGLVLAVAYIASAIHVWSLR